MLLVDNSFNTLGQDAVLQRQVLDCGALQVRSVKLFLSLWRHSTELDDLRLLWISKNLLLQLPGLAHMPVVFDTLLVRERFHQIWVVDNLIFNCVFNKRIIAILLLHLFLITIGRVHLLKHASHIRLELLQAVIVLTSIDDILDLITIVFKLSIVAILVASTVN